ncbi:MAG: DUF721 domain-containing protein [Candidatus Moranbacteria bacterium]|nr:DUF721 domain-containing protein [Candidatus Moranbacteria bacterium]
MFGIGNDIRRIMVRKGLLDQVEAFMVCRYGQEAIEKLCKNKFYRPEVVKFLKNTGTLEVRLKNFSVGQAIRNKNREILFRINEKMGGEFVQKIRFRMG